MSPEPEIRDLVFTRVFDAPVERVWKAWTDAEDVKYWWGPDRFTAPLARLEVRPGGTSLVCMRAPAEFGGQDMYSTWHYRDVVPLQRLVYLHNLADADGRTLDPVTLGLPPDFPQDVRNTITFKALSPTRTELTVTEHDWPVGQMREMSRLGMEQCLDKMARLFAEA